MASTATPDTSTGAHYGADYSNFVAEWDGAISDITFGIREGYLDKHLGDLVKSAITRRKHLADHNLVPELPVDPAKGRDVVASTGATAGTPSGQAESDAGSVNETTAYGEPFVTYMGKRFAKADIVGKYVALRDYRDMTGAIVKITGIGKTRPDFELAIAHGNYEAGMAGSANLDQISALFNLSS